jgi:hypothetical protein
MLFTGGVTKKLSLLMVDMLGCVAIDVALSIGQLWWGFSLGV